MNRKLLTDSIVFSASRYVLIGLSVVRNLVVARMLGPDEYGFWVIVTLILTYGDQAHFGLRHAGDREIPYWRGVGDEARASRIADTLYATVVRLAALLCLAMGVYVLLQTHQPPVYRIGLFLTGLVVASDQINRFYLMYMRTRKEFVLSSKVETFFELMRTLLLVALGFSFRVDGALAAMVIASGSNAWWIFRKYRHLVRPRLDRALLGQMIRAGWPLFISSALYILILSFDRLVIFLLSFDRLFGDLAMPKVAVGLYGFAALIAQLPVSAAQAIRDVLYPTVTERFGEHSDATSLQVMYGKSMIGLGILLPPMIGVVVYTGEMMIHVLLPAFTPSIPTLAVISLGIPFLALAALPMGTLMATGRNRTLVVVEVVSLVVTAGACVILLRSPGGMFGLALSSVLLFFMFGVLTMERTYAVLGLSGPARARQLVLVTFPSFYVIALMCALDVFLPQNASMSTGASLRVIATKGGVFLLAYLPLLIAMELRYGITRKLRGMRGTASDAGNASRDADGEQT
jgi:O-antigen/teichoic acid export membrane protein